MPVSAIVRHGAHVITTQAVFVVFTRRRAAIAFCLANAVLAAVLRRRARVYRRAGRAGTLADVILRAVLIGAQRR